MSPQAATTEVRAPKSRRSATRESHCNQKLAHRKERKPRGEQPTPRTAKNKTKINLNTLWSNSMALLEIEAGPHPRQSADYRGREVIRFAREQEHYLRALSSGGAHSKSPDVIAWRAPEGLLSRFADDETKAERVSASPWLRVGTGEQARDLLLPGAPASPLGRADGSRAPLAGLPCVCVCVCVCV